jgi:hypothetical protein
MVEATGLKIIALRHSSMAMEYQANYIHLNESYSTVH